MVIKVNDIYDGTETSINNVFTNINLGTSSIKNLSRILSIKAFENNVVATSELTTKVTEGTTSVYVTVEVSSSLMLLPETPMTGRLDNARVGYFRGSRNLVGIIVSYSHPKFRPLPHGNKSIGGVGSHRASL